MQTTILDGETYGEALSRRCAEEAETDRRIAGLTEPTGYQPVCPIVSHCKRPIEASDTPSESVDKQRENRQHIYAGSFPL